MNKNKILSKLEPFRNTRTLIIENQGIKDIINGILYTNDLYKSEYDKISDYFLGDGIYETCENIWNFLKINVPYRIESDSRQTLRSPTAIFMLSGADCKSYSLAAVGIVSSLVRKGAIDCDVCFRFAGYNNSKDLQHVFCVIKKNGKEIWIDPVLSYFNEKKQYSFHKDKNINMALISLAGVPTSLPTTPSFVQTLQAVTTPTTSTNILSSVQSLATGISSTGIPIISSVAAAVSLLSDLFANKPSPNDWIGWDAMDTNLGQWFGSSVRGWVLNDGDSVQNEALNIVSYIKAKGIDVLTNTGHPVTVQGQGWRDVTIDEIVNKLSRGGYSSEAAQIKAAYLASPSAQLAPGTLPGTTPIAKAGINIWLTIGLAGAAIFAISKMKK